MLHRLRTLSVFLTLLFAVLPLRAQLAQLLPQQALKQWRIPAGNYSGITPLGEQLYAVVSDKSPQLGYFVWRIVQDSINGQVSRVENLGFRQLHSPVAHSSVSPDVEDLVFDAANHRIWLANEGNQSIAAFDTLRKMQVDSLAIPEFFRPDSVYDNLGFEALAHDTDLRLWYSTSESPLRSDAPARPEQLSSDFPLRLRIVQWNAQQQVLAVLPYSMATPQLSRSARYYLHGVPALCVLPNGALLVMERELSVPRRFVGAKCQIRLRLLSPTQPNVVHEVATWRTHLDVFRRSFANYEGMCLGRRLADGRQTVICVSDAQGGAGRFGVHLRDFLRVVVLERQCTD